MAIADMFLKVQGATGESTDAQHKGEIGVVSWSWAMRAERTHSSIAGPSMARGAATIDELEIVKRADLSTPTLMLYLLSHKVIKLVRLTVRKAGQHPLEYLVIDLEDAVLTSLQTEAQNAEVLEHLRFSFSKMKVTYTPQDASGGPGGANQVEHDLTAH